MAIQAQSQAITEANEVPDSESPGILPGTNYDLLLESLQVGMFKTRGDESLYPKSPLPQRPQETDIIRQRRSEEIDNDKSPEGLSTKFYQY